MARAADLERQVAAALFRSGFAPGETTMVVASSGGPDSTALLRCLHGLRDEHRLALHVAHLNHDFRGAEADHDAAFVQLLADGLGLPCSIDKQDPIAYQRERGISSFEQAAREMRYSFLAAVAASAGASAVALGHTADDQAETLLLHLLRGSGLHGLAGMSELTQWPWPEPNPGPLIFRPLLGAGKAETSAYCRKLGQNYRDDSGNYMWRFTRNKVRLDLMPRLARDYNPRVREALARLSRAAAEDLDFIEGELTRRWASVAEEREDAVVLNTDALSALHPSLQRHALRRAFAAVAGDSRRLGEGHLGALLALLQLERSGRALDLPRGIRAEKQGDVMVLSSKAQETLLPELIGEHKIILPGHPGGKVVQEVEGWRMTLKVVEAGTEEFVPQGDTPLLFAYLNRDVLGKAATLRTRRPGDRFQPSGMTGTKKLQDFFTDAKVPRKERDRIPLVVSDRGIAWVAGHRAAEWARARASDAALLVSLAHLDPRGDSESLHPC